MTPTHKIKETIRILRKTQQFTAATMLSKVAQERDALAAHRWCGMKDEILKRFADDLAQSIDRLIKRALDIHNIDITAATLTYESHPDRTDYFANGKLIISMMTPEINGEDVSIKYFIAKRTGVKL